MRFWTPETEASEVPGAGLKPGLGPPLSAGDPGPPSLNSDRQTPPQTPEAPPLRIRGEGGKATRRPRPGQERDKELSRGRNPNEMRAAPAAGELATGPPRMPEEPGHPGCGA